MKKYEIEKYYVWRNGNHADDDGFFEFEDALEFAKENNCDEIEKTCWETEDAYKNREPADYFEVAWRR